ncbi:hypothetical protein H5410_004300 [Solanum commersonii]|uniref:Integrase core domain containing protein n=1 Tax=Solanum commersonii TaxID=4109 RepID=A0A9J6B834_SOLCO|nr:hypothetical protein H5410_004300 [Solanum commersonii]
MARLIIEERRVLTGSLHTIPNIHRLFKFHKYDWMVRGPMTYSEEIVREFYTFYAVTLRGSISKQSKPTTHDPLTSTMVRGCPVNISHATINHFLYGPTTGHSWTLNPTEFDYRWDIVRGALSREMLSSSRLLHYGLIRDDVNVVAPCREPQVEVPSLGTDLADTVEQAQGGDPIIPGHTDTVPASSSQAACKDPSSSRSTPPSGSSIFPMARVYKLEAQMATLLHHIQPWMQKSIVEFEVKIEKRVESRQSSRSR